jgi:hypothetical protein
LAAAEAPQFVEDPHIVEATPPMLVKALFGCANAEKQRERRRA